MAIPALDLYPSTTLFPGLPRPVDFGGYEQPIECALADLVLTATDSEGVDWVQDTLSGWYGSPASSKASTQKTRAPGAWTGPGDLTSKTLTLSGYVEAPSAAALLDAFDRLNAAASISDTILTVVESGSARSLTVRRAGEVLTDRAGDTGGVWSVQLAADDPRKFAAPVSGSTGLPSVSGGLTIPYTVPYTVDSVVNLGIVTLTNRGNMNGPTVVRFDGPLTGPKVTHMTSGLTVAFSPLLTLGVDEWLIVDMEGQTALANGQASRNLLITERGWSPFLTGGNEWAFSAASGSGLMTVTGTPTWL